MAKSTCERKNKKRTKKLKEIDNKLNEFKVCIEKIGKIKKL